MSLIVQGLHKKYNFRLKNNEYVVKDLSFNIEDGQIYSLIGQNGVGKTTTIKCILKLIKINKGKVTVDDKDIQRLMENNQVGYLPENLMFPGFVSLYEFLYDLCVLKGVEKNVAKQAIDELAIKFELYDMLNKDISKFSKGMKRKVGFIQAIINQPKVLILDEPTDGLDPISRKKVLNYIREFANKGNIILITSHILSDLSLISDKVGLMDDGKLISEINLKESLNNNNSRITFEIKNGTYIQDRVYDLKPMTEIDVSGVERCVIKDFSTGGLDLEDWYFKELLKKGAIRCGK
jgi:ABC-2 type transport system ATP-binding protein